MHRSTPLAKRAANRLAAMTERSSLTSSSASPPRKQQRVCIIGGGASGLTALKNLREYGIEAHLFEQEARIGGTWNYSDDDGPDATGSMYASLSTNLTKYQMQFSDFPFPDEVPDHPHHTEVLAYLEDYSSRFDLYPHIQTSARIQSTKFNHSRQTWTVEVVGTGASPRSVSEQTGDRNSSEASSGDDMKRINRGAEESKERIAGSQTLEFDALCVCNGHYTYPWISPEFEAPDPHVEVLHSHWYRTPERFQGRRVLVVGAGYSGVDIANELAGVASSLHLSVKQGPDYEDMISYLGERIVNSGKEWRLFDSPAYGGKMPCVDYLESGSKRVKFTDGSFLDVDIILLCTGYVYKFPFLESGVVDTSTPRVVCKTLSILFV